MQKLKNIYLNQHFNKFLYGICTLSVIGIALTINAYRKIQKQKESSLKKFSEVQSITNSETNKIDQCSLSNIDEVTTINTSINLSINFNEKILVGKVELKMKAKKKITKVSLDSKHLIIKTVEVNHQAVNFNLQQLVIPALGGRLDIETEQAENSEFIISIVYQTQKNLNNEQVASNWLEPQQTFGNKYPFLFTQSEAIYARTLFPCQDTPSIKSTFDIELSVQAPLKAYGSGLFVKELNLDGQNIYTYKQPVPIPAYLFAICAGDLEKKQVSERTFVIAEPNFVNNCVAEFSEMENYLKNIEAYLTKYIWTEYTAVVLPKAFPFGGMENPNLTFLSPSLIVGDKSETAVVIHEMVHSWSGNCMTCQNWECFWLNEGITTFIENTIVGRIFGKDSQILHALLGNNSLQKAVESYGQDHTYTSLSPKIGQQNPDDCFSSIPYMKGFQFLKYLESQIGEDYFRLFINIVVKQQTLNSNQFKELFENFIKDNGLKQVDMKWQEWVINPGMPIIQLNIPQNFIKKYNDLAEQLFKNELEPEEFNKLSAHEQCYILDLLGQFQLTNETVRNLDEDYGLFDSQNAEIIYRLLIFAINTGYPKDNHLTNFLQKNGRMKFINPVYRKLAEKEYEKGLRIFNMCKSGYHSIAVAQIQKMFQK